MMAFQTAAGLIVGSTVGPGMVVNDQVKQPHGLSAADHTFL